MATNWKIGNQIQNCWEIHIILRGMGILYAVFGRTHGAVYASRLSEMTFSAVMHRINGAAH